MPPFGDHLALLLEPLVLTFGGGTTAESYGQTTLGFYNTTHPGTPNTTANVGSDRLLVVGNGTGSTVRSDFCYP